MTTVRKYVQDIYYNDVRHPWDAHVNYFFGPEDGLCASVYLYNQLTGGTYSELDFDYAPFSLPSNAILDAARVGLYASFVSVLDNPAAGWVSLEMLAYSTQSPYNNLWSFFAGYTGVKSCSGSMWTIHTLTSTELAQLTITELNSGNWNAGGGTCYLSAGITQLADQGWFYIDASYIEVDYHVPTGVTRGDGLVWIKQQLPRKARFPKFTRPVPI
jgi:hypothetical protein